MIFIRFKIKNIKLLELNVYRLYDKLHYFVLYCFTNLINLQKQIHGMSDYETSHKHSKKKYLLLLFKCATVYYNVNHEKIKA